MNQKGPVSVLLAPLDWGLGHATRCIPIINELVRQGARVMIAANGDQKSLLYHEFPMLSFIEIPGYNIKFKGGHLSKWSLLFQLPIILNRIKKEKAWLKKTVEIHKISAVISDNRYGLYHKNLYCVFITHQLNIQSGWGSRELVSGWRVTIGRWIDKKILNRNYSFIKKFSACWVPDFEKNNSLSGKLSHPVVLPPLPVKYIGLLSRFKKEERKIISNSMLIIISGPEPQRTEFENILFAQIADSTIQTILVRGLPTVDLTIPFVREGLEIYNHLPADKLNELLITSEYILSRSGYSTIMDLIALKRNAILVPTPGQTEQEYLARYMYDKKWMFSVQQKEFNLKTVLKKYRKTKMELPEIPETNLIQLVKDFLSEISIGNGRKIN